MKDNICPTCQGDLEWQSKDTKNQSIYQCNSCQITYTKIAHCPDCQSVLEVLQACGSASYFCPTCNELKSKSRVAIQFSTIA